MNEIDAPDLGREGNEKRLLNTTTVKPPSIHTNFFLAAYRLPVVRSEHLLEYYVLDLSNRLSLLKRQLVIIDFKIIYSLCQYSCVRASSIPDSGSGNNGGIWLPL